MTSVRRSATELLIKFRELNGYRHSLEAIGPVLFYSLLVQSTGEGRNFFVVNIVGCFILAIVFGASLGTGRPVTLRICRRLGLEPAETSAARLRLHRRITGLWFLNWVLHVLVFAPLYAMNKVAALGVSQLIFGKPSVLLMIAATWLWVRRAARPATEPSANN